MTKFKFILVLLLAFGLFSCEKVLLKPNPSSENLAVFDEYVKIVTEKYAMLEFKGVDIETLSDSLRATVTPDLSQSEFFTKMGTITERLRDGHSHLYEDIANGSDPDKLYAGFDIVEGYPPAFSLEILANNYIGNAVNPEVKLVWTEDSTDIRAIYGTLPQDRDIGYIWIPSWSIEMTDEELDNIFQDMQSTKGMVVDMRQNGGGDPALSTKFASYFMSAPTYTGFERFKTGPGKFDFTDSPSTVQPTSSEYRYLKPVVVLTDRGCYSATTTFAYSVNPLPQVTFLGQRTGGGSGSVAEGFLANGWAWALSTSEFIDHDGNHLDDGFDPDIAVALDTMDVTKDELIEAAILELQ